MRQSTYNLAGVYRVLAVCSVLATIMWLVGVLWGISPDTRSDRITIVGFLGVSYVLTGLACFRWARSRNLSVWTDQGLSLFGFWVGLYGLVLVALSLREAVAYNLLF